MSGTAVALLTAPGTGAIATVEVRGPRAWELAKQLFKPAGKPLLESPEANRFWFGTLGSDEVVLAVTSPDAIEVHCHGGRRVVRWVIEQFTSRGCIETTRTPRPSGDGFELLQQAPTLRTASILLDQLNGAFANEVRRILALLETDPRGAAFSLHRLAELGNTVGRHLVEPWKVVIAGPPNVGKSSLVNALAGYQRSVVSEVAGTTRDAVSVRAAFDGWPVELIDTAGLRDATGLEAEGIERRTRRKRGEPRIVLCGSWTRPTRTPKSPTSTSYLLTDHEPLVVANKCDQPAECDPNAIPYFDGTVKALAVSAKTGAGVSGAVHRSFADFPERASAAWRCPAPRTLIELVNDGRRAALAIASSMGKATMPRGSSAKRSRRAGSLTSLRLCRCPSACPRSREGRRASCDPVPGSSCGRTPRSRSAGPAFRLPSRACWSLACGARSGVGAGACAAFAGGVAVDHEPGHALPPAGAVDAGLLFLDREAL